MRTLARAGAVVVAFAAVGSSNADTLIYRFYGSVLSNGIVSGGFAGAPVGSSVMLEYTVNTATTPAFSDANRSHWDGVAGTILGMRAVVNGYTSVVTPSSSAAFARVTNDALAAGGSAYFDQFWMEVNATGSAPDFVLGRVAMESISPTLPVSSSLTAPDWPSDSSQLDPSTFTGQKHIILRLSGPQFINASITDVVIIPAPAGVWVAVLAVAGCARRRRRE